MNGEFGMGCGFFESSKRWGKRNGWTLKKSMCLGVRGFLMSSRSISGVYLVAKMIGTS